MTDWADQVLDEYYKTFPQVYAWWKENNPRTMARAQWKVYYRKLRIDQWFVESAREPRIVYHLWSQGKRVKNFPPGGYQMKML